GEPVMFNGANEHEVILSAALASDIENPDAIDSAILQKLNDDKALQSFQTQHFMPFDPVQKRTETDIKTGQNHLFKVSKGAPQVVLDLCNPDNSLRERAEKTVNEFALKGYRALGVAKTDEAGHWIFLGILSLFDPPREDAASTIKDAKAHGVDIKMVTGDNIAIAKQIAAELGLGENILLANQIIKAKDKEDIIHNVAQCAERADGFAQVFPEHKYWLIKDLQANNHLIGMTGDGVNDAPALKRADVGTAMGLNRTEVAKEAAEMVLADDNFSSIAQAVEEGRMVYDNLRKAILFILPTNGGEALTIIAAIMFGRMLPITPVQILWVNMITAVTLALALAFEPAEKDIMQRPPRDSHQPILTGMFIWRIIFVSIILLFGTFGLFIWEREQGASIELARTIAVNTLVMFEIFYLFSSRYILANVFTFDGLFGNRYALMAVAILIIFQLAFTYIAPMQALFDTVAIDIIMWLRIILVASSVLFLVELEKAFIRYFKST
ncbi:MAG: HAD-IC family P-type ATPase, partial [Thiotrichaceae bacterium]|nr:HAD-IC family P-type ATPase [Thiotrichaceae bacterium]